MNLMSPLNKISALAFLGALACTSAHSVDLSYSAFGTVGGAVSDQPYQYQRFIDAGGTLKRDSVLGAQVDAQFTPELSATLQGKFAPSMRVDQGWDVSASWAFASWRPSNEWLVRAGKLRIPLYLFSENLDVGQSYDFVRMPTEMYSIAPTTDIAGVYLTRNWALEDADLSVDAYSGRASVWARFYGRNTGALFSKVNTKVTGSVLTLRLDNTLMRAGWHHADSRPTGNFAIPSRLATDFFTTGNYTTANKISNDIVTIGMDKDLPDNWRLLLEYQRDFQHGTDFGANTSGGYISILKSIDKWTPYVSASLLKTLGAPARIQPLLNQAADQIEPISTLAAAGYRSLADVIPYYDQYSLCIGTSYALNPNAKIKGEVMHTWVKKGSVMIDSPSGGPSLSNQEITTLSMSYNFAY